MNLIDAMESSELFGRFFKPQPDGTDTWGRWKAFGACLMGVAVPDEMQATGFTHLTGRLTGPRGRSRRPWRRIVSTRRAWFWVRVACSSSSCE